MRVDILEHSLRINGTLDESGNSIELVELMVKPDAFNRFRRAMVSVNAVI